VSPIANNPALIPPGGLNGPAAPGGAGAPARKAPAGASTAPGQGAPSFADALTQADRSQAERSQAPAGSAGAAQPLQFSRHALARVQRRGIELDPSTLGRLSQGVQRAAGKGSRDSLVLVDGTAFVVSVANRTVITAVGSEHMKDNVFTNIDSAVIA
jgi:flagellar operon protein